LNDLFTLGILKVFQIIILVRK